MNETCMIPKPRIGKSGLSIYIDGLRMLNRLSWHAGVLMIGRGPHMWYNGALMHDLNLSRWAVQPFQYIYRLSQLIEAELSVVS
jgi:hypothetical protein